MSTFGRFVRGTPLLIIAAGTGIACGADSSNADAPKKVAEERLATGYDPAARESIVASLRRFGLSETESDLAPLTAPRLQTDLGATAAGWFRVRDVASGMELRARLEGGNEKSEGVTVDGYLVFPEGFQGATIVHRATASAVEDFALLRARPVVPELRYAIELVDVAGLRLVSNTLELLDDGGAPRLRVAPPYLVDSLGIRRDVKLAVEGCRVDVNPASPWGRSVVSPGGSQCTLVASWDSGVRYPALIDPEWQSTGGMVMKRYGHTAILLKNDKVLAVGGAVAISGLGSPTPTASAELFDAGTKTWAATGSMYSPRLFHVASLLASGRVLVGGGGAMSSELYDPSSGVFGSPASMLYPRSNATASPLPSGNVLVPGGADANGNAQSSCETYNPTTNKWSNVEDDMKTRRSAQAAVALTDGRVLVVGGRGEAVNSPPGSDVDLASAEVFDESISLNKWALVASMSEPRSLPAATLLKDGSVLVALGVQIPMVKAAEIYSPMTNKWAYTGTMAQTPYSGAGISLLPNDCVLLNGGGDEFGSSTAVALFDPKSTQWATADPMAQGRGLHTATLLSNGSVLVAGGLDSAKLAALSSAEIFSMTADGAACANNCECTSGACIAGVCCIGFAVDGVCCKTKCDGLCEKCGADGECKLAAAGTDADNDCADKGAASCDTNGSCDGKGACALYPKDTACGKNGCDGPALLSAQCNGAGKCVSNSTACAPFLCDPSTSMCFDKCKSIDDCAPPNACTAEGACTPPIPPDTTPEEIGGCGCGVPGHDGLPLHLGAIALVGLAALRLRAQRRRPSAR